MLCYWHLWIKKNCPHTFACCWLLSERSLDWCLQTYQFHTLIFTFWITAVISTSSPVTMHIRQVVLRVIWKVLADIQSWCLCYSVSCLVMHLAQSLWKTSMFWIIPWVEPWVIFHVIKSHPSVIQNCGTSSFSVLISSAHGWLPWSFCISCTRAPFFTCQSIQIHFTLVKYCSHSVLKVFYEFWPLIYLQLTKNGSMHAALFGAQTSHINTTAVTKQLIIQGWNSNTVTGYLQLYT
jgi:hypothetical protein